MRSQPYFFAFDTKTKPGFVLCDFVNVDTLELPLDLFEESTFTTLGADYDNDLRIRAMIHSAMGFKI